jgi:hypothetical protein
MKQTLKSKQVKKAKLAKKTLAAPKRKPVAVAVATVVARLVDGPIPYLEAIVREKVSEETMVRVFELVRVEILRYQAKRLLVDLREGSVSLTISDMLGLAKLVATAFAGVLERFALLLLPQDVLAEKFFEPSVSSRGLPTFVTTDAEEATYWISAKIRSVR